MQYNSLCQVSQSMASIVSVDVPCPCCFNREPLAPSHIKGRIPVSFHCLQEHMRNAALFLQKAASLSPELPVVKLSTGGAVNCALINSFNKGEQNSTSSSCTTWKSYM